MENASKALIIAGAILLSILIIAIGMYIYNSSQNSINQAATQISQQEVNAFNATFLMYEDKQIGTNVRSLINAMSSGASQNAEEESKLPDLVYQAASASEDPTTVTSVVGDTQISAFNTARTAIQARHYYYVQFELNATSGLIDKVIVSYEKGSLTNNGGTWQKT